jgi:hypothetical protein
MSKRLLLLNVPVVAIALVFAVLLAREFVVSRPLPPPPAPRASLPRPTFGETAAPTHDPASDLSAFSMIAARNLFNPARSETAGVVAAKQVGRPVLHGVVLDGQRSRAYIEDPLAKGVFGYTVGDTVGQGQIKTISADRIMIAGPEGTFELLLHDPSKPKPAAPGVVGAPTAPRAPAVPAAPGALPVRRSAPGAALAQPPAADSQSSDN